MSEVISCGSNYKKGKLVIEGKTKEVYEIVGCEEEVLVVSKDRITAGDGVRAHNLKGKAAISTRTNAQVFKFLNAAGIKTSFIDVVSSNVFRARKCAMVPIEWVTRRLATGSFLKRQPTVPEGYRFSPPKQETCFKDDANHDPIWSEEEMLSAEFNLNGVVVERCHLDIMRRTALAVFEVLERAWASRNCALVDMKIEFGIDSRGEILVSDVIDSDSWRLWPHGDKRLMKDKQVYRNLAVVTEADLQTVKSNFQWIADQLDHFVTPTAAKAYVIMGSTSDLDHCKKIRSCCEKLGLPCELRVCSAHKATEETLRMLAEIEGSQVPAVLVACAGRSNGLGPVLSANTVLPVINCPPVNPDNLHTDIWSSLNVPSGLGCSTVMYAETAALAAVQIHALHDHLLWSKLRVKALNNYIGLRMHDLQLTRSASQK